MQSRLWKRLSVRPQHPRKTRPTKSPWARLSLETLDQRILPSVTATLQGGILSVGADTTGGTTQVEIIQAQNQITIEDTGTLVNNFDITQIQQVQFQYNQFTVAIPVNGSQMTLTGFALQEADLNLGDSSLAAAVNATLPDATAVNLAGTVNADGTFDLAGSAAIQVDNFPLNANLDLTDQSLAMSTHLSIPSALEVDLSGSLDNQGNYDLTGAAAVTVAGFTLPATSFELTNTTLTAAAALAVGNDSVNLAGSVDNQGNYDLTGTAAVTVGSFGLPGVSFELTNNGLTAAAALAIGSDSVSLAGTVDNQGNYDVTGTANVIVGGVSLSGAAFELTNNGLAAAAALAVGTSTVNLAGSVDNQGNYQLTGTGQIPVAGFNLDANLTLTNTSLMVSTTLNVGSAGSVNLSGTYANGQFGDLSGTGALTVAGLNLTVNATYHNSTLTFTSTVALGSLGNVNLSGTYASGQPLSLTGTGTIMVAGFNLNASVTVNTAILVSTSLAVGTLGSINLSGTFSNGQLADLSGTGTLTIAGLSLTVNATYHNSTLTFTSTVALGALGNVNVSGTYASGQPLSLTGTGTITVAGFSLNATITVGTAITVSASLAVGTLGSVNLSGTFSNGHLSDLTGSGTLTVAGFSLTVQGTYSNGTLRFSTVVSINGSNVNLSGTYASGQPLSLTGSAAINIAGFSLTPSFTLTVSGLAVAVGVAIPSVGTLNFAGTVDSHGSFSLTVTPHLVIAGVGLDATFRLTNTSLTVSATVNLPIVGPVNLSGTVDSHGNYSVTAAIPNITILFVTLTNATVMLTNSSLTVTARASNLPLIGNLTLTGTITGNSYTFTATIPSLSILGFALPNIAVSLNTTSLSVSTHVSNIPLVGSADFTGTVTAAGFSLSATVPNITVLGFVHFASVSLTLNAQSLSMRATTTLPVVGAVTFSGAINAGGFFTISATAPHFSVLGFLGIDNATVSIVFPYLSLTVSAHLSLLNIGTVDFVGGIGATGTFSFNGHAALTVAGFNLGTGNLHFGNMPGDPGNAIQIGPFTTPALPVIGAVTLQGSYAAGGMFSFSADVNPTPPIFIGPIPFNHFHLGLTNTSLSIGAGVGFSIAGALDLSGSAQVTIHTNGDFDLLATVNATVLGFSAANASLEIQKDQVITHGVVTMTLDGNLNLIVVTAHLHGFIDFAHAQFSLTGSANITVAGFTLSNSTLVATNIPDPVHYPGVNLRVEVHSHTNILNIGFVNFDGALLKSGSTYSISVHALATFQVDGFTLPSARLDLDNTHLAISVSDTYFVGGSGFSATFSGSMDWHGNFDLSGSASVTLAGFSATGSVHLTNSSLTITANINVFVTTVNFTGYFRADGSFLLTGSASVGLGGFSAVTGSFTLSSSSGLQVSASVNVIVAQATFTGSIDTHGNYSLSGSGSAGFAGFGGEGSFTLSNSGVWFSGVINCIVAGIHVSGSISSSGTFSFSLSTRMGFVGFGAFGSLTLNNSGVTVSATLDLSIIGIRMNCNGAIHSDGTFSFTFHAGLNFFLLPVSASVDLTLSNNGFSAQVHAALDVSAGVSFGPWSVRIGFRGSFDIGFGIHTDGSFSANGSVQMTGYLVLVGLTVGIHVTVDNHQFCIKTSEIGFSIWGVGFHPFGDLCISY